MLPSLTKRSFVAVGPFAHFFTTFVSKSKKDRPACQTQIKSAPCGLYAPFSKEIVFVRYAFCCNQLLYLFELVS